MRTYDPNEGERRRNMHADLNPSEPSMSAPSPMPGKPAASYVKPQQEQIVSQADWQPPQNQQPAQNGWPSQQYYPAGQRYASGTVQQSYPQATPSQGIPGGQLPPQQYSWQQGYAPPPQQGYPHNYQQPTGRGWTQPYPNQPQQNPWQGGYTINQWPGNGYAPAYDQPPVQTGGQNASSGGSGRTPMKPRTLIAFIAAAAILVLIVVLAGNSISRSNASKAAQEAVAAYSERYCEGVYVDGIHLGGMTREEAKAAVQQSAQLKCDEWNVALVTTGGEYVGEINSYHLGMTVHVDDALNDAWTQGHTGASVAERKAAMDALLETPYHTSTALPSGDTAAIDRILNEFAASVYIAPVDASATFNEMYTNPFEIIDEVVGRELDVDSIKHQVYDMVSRMESGTIILQTREIRPNYTRADLEKLTTLIGSHYTVISSTSTEERNLNVKQACDLINGTVIYPGESFSFNSVVGPRTKKNGFHLATVYNYGKEEPGYGGGVCQVSSTIYVAAIRANMEITKRSQHGLIVGYTELGLDATVNYDGRKIDFAFRNNTGSPIYIITKVMRKPKIDRSHDLVVCEIYGPALEEGVTYDLVATQVEVPIPEATIVPDKEAAYVIYTDDPPYTEPGRIGYEVDSYKVKYVNGEEVERTPMYHDTYKPVQPIIYMGVNERPITTIAPW